MTTIGWIGTGNMALSLIHISQAFGLPGIQIGSYNANLFWF